MHPTFHLIIGSLIPVALILLGFAHLRSPNKQYRSKTQYVLRISFWGSLLGFIYVQIALSSGITAISEPEIITEDQLDPDGPNITASWFLFGIAGIIVSLITGMKLISPSSKN